MFLLTSPKDHLNSLQNHLSGQEDARDHATVLIHHQVKTGICSYVFPLSFPALHSVIIYMDLGVPSSLTSVLAAQVEVDNVSSV